MKQLWWSSEENCDSFIQVGIVSNRCNNLFNTLELSETGFLGRDKPPGEGNGGLDRQCKKTNIFNKSDILQ